MRAITLHQPWASLIACGAKKIETRSWSTNYRGQIAIHAGKTIDKESAYTEPALSMFAAKGINPKDGLPTGAVIAIADLVDCQEMTKEKIAVWRRLFGVHELAFGDFEPGRYAWILDNIRPIKLIPTRGMQRIWNWDGDVDC